MGKKSNFSIVLSRLIKNRAAVFGMIVLGLLLLLAVIAPFIMPYDYAAVDAANIFQTPSLEHLFGTDELGRDIFSRLLYGTKYSLALGIVSIAFAFIIGSAIGAVAGYFGGTVDIIIMRIIDIVSSIPSLLLAICISAVLGNGFEKCIIALAIAQMPMFVRMLRAQIFSIRDMEYVEAAASINCTKFRIIVKHILPNAITPLIVQATMGIANSITMAAGMSFVGIGVQPPTPEWGAMLSAAKGYIRNYPYMVMFPGAAIMITVLSINMVGDALRDAMDPKLKK